MYCIMHGYYWHPLLLFIPLSHNFLSLCSRSINKGLENPLKNIHISQTCCIMHKCLILIAAPYQHWQMLCWWHPIFLQILFHVLQFTTRKIHHPIILLTLYLHCVSGVCCILDVRKQNNEAFLQYNNKHKLYNTITMSDADIQLLYVQYTQ